MEWGNSTLNKGIEWLEALICYSPGQLGLSRFSGTLKASTAEW